MENKPEIRIYVACLAAYNNGILHGRWIDANQEALAIYDEIAEMLKASPISGAEEAAIHDHEGFEGYELEEYASIDRVSLLAAFIAEHGKLGGQLVAHFCGDLDEARQALEDRYAGEHASLADFAQEITEQSAEIPEGMRYYIDYDRMARDMAISDVIAIEIAHDEVHVFWTH